MQACYEQRRMFEKGNLLLFRPFVFKNGATPEDKFFISLGELDEGILLASLPTSQKTRFGGREVETGCNELDGGRTNVYKFKAGDLAAKSADGREYCFLKDTYVVGKDLDTYPTINFLLQKNNGLLDNVKDYGVIVPEQMDKLIDCLKKSKAVRNKYKTIL